MFKILMVWNVYVLHNQDDDDLDFIITKTCQE